MTRKNRELAKAILKKCHSLDDADDALTKLTPVPSKATRWGLWDGWAYRPRANSGLGIERDTPASRQAAHEYEAAYDMGYELAKEDRT